jgi:haloalkane dehalogenase
MTSSDLRRTVDGVPFLRSPDSNFDGLDGYSFPANYLNFEGLRLHYVDVGPRNGPAAMLMHGMPTWSYLNRHIIHALVAKGWRCIAHDHIGFGRSDKVTDPAWYSIRRHAVACRALIEALDLKGITLFVQDWGGPTGLAQAAETGERFSRLVIMNTWLPHEGYVYSQAIRTWADAWKPGGLYDMGVPDRISLGDIMMLALGYVPMSAVRDILATGQAPPLAPQALALKRAYDAPHQGLDPRAFTGPRRFPLSIPIDLPKDPTALDGARHFEMLKGWTKPIHFIWGGVDRIFTPDWGRAWAALYPNATFDLIPDAGHFLQETHGAEIARRVLQQVARGAN